MLNCMLKVVVCEYKSVVWRFNRIDIFWFHCRKSRCVRKNEQERDRKNSEEECVCECQREKRESKSQSSWMETEKMSYRENDIKTKLWNLTEWRWCCCCTNNNNTTNNIMPQNMDPKKLKHPHPFTFTFIYIYKFTAVICVTGGNLIEMENADRRQTLNSTRQYQPPELLMVWEYNARWRGWSMHALYSTTRRAVVLTRI